MVNIREHVLLGHRRPGRGDRKGQGRILAAIHRVRFNQALERQRGADQPGRHGGGRRHRRHPRRADLGQRRQEGLPGRARADHRRPHGQVRQDLPDARLRRLHPHAQDVGGRQGHPNITLLDLLRGRARSTATSATSRSRCASKPRYVDEDSCVGCPECIDACVFRRKFPDEFNLGLSKRKPVYIPFPQAVPQVVLIDPETCLKLSAARSARRPASRPAVPNAIDFKQQDEIIEIEVGAIILATGFEPFDPAGDPTTATGATTNVYTAWRWSGSSTPRAPPAARSSARRRAAQGGRDHPLRRLPRREHQQLLLPRLLHVLAEAGAPDQGAPPRPRSTTSTSTCGPPARATRSSTSGSWTRACTSSAAASPRSAAGLCARRGGAPRRPGRGHAARHRSGASPSDMVILLAGLEPRPMPRTSPRPSTSPARPTASSWSATPSWRR